jgi:hypothetical protein
MRISANTEERDRQLQAPTRHTPGYASNIDRQLNISLPTGGDGGISLVSGCQLSTKTLIVGGEADVLSHRPSWRRAAPLQTGLEGEGALIT